MECARGGFGIQSPAMRSWVVALSWSLDVLLDQESW